MKIREEINKIENGKKSLETKSWFFERINKIDKPQVRIIKQKKKREHK